MDDYRKYLIEILLRAREEVSNAAAKANEALNKVTGAQKDATEAERAATVSSKEHRDELDRLHTSHTREKKDLSDVASKIRDIGNESDHTNRKGRGLSGWLRGLKADSRDAELSLSKLSASLKGFQVAFAIKYAQALLTSLVALGGELVAVAASAIQAGLALGGALAAGAAQAVPVIGIIAASVVRLTAVFKALTLFNQQKLLGAHDAQAAAQRQEAAAQSIKSSEQGLADAHRNVAEAQNAVTLARAAAIRQVQDLIAAEGAAKRAAEGAALSLESAQAALRQAIRSGDSGSIAQAELDVRNARADRTAANRGVTRARQDAAPVRARGIQGVEAFRQSEQSLADARRSEARAADQLTQARKGATEAAIKETSANDRLNAMLKQLSPAERGLYERMKNLQKIFQDNVRPITDIIIRSFSRVADRVGEVLQDPKVLGAFTKLAQAMADALDHLTKIGSSKQAMGFFTSMTNLATKSVPVINDIFEKLFQTFQNIAKAGAPAFKMLIDFVDSLAGRAEKASSNTDRLAKFFETGIGYLEQWVELGIQISRLFLAIIGQSAQQGTKSIAGLTKVVQNATKWVQTHGDKVRKFFSDSSAVVGQLGRIVVAIGEQVIRAFDPGNVKAFADFMVNVVAPALGNVIVIMGEFTQLAHEFLSLPFVSDAVQWLATVALLNKGFGILSGALKGVGAMLGFVSIKGKLAFVSNPWVLAISAILASFVLLKGGIHDVGDALRDLAIAFAGFMLATRTGILGKLGISGIFARGAATKAVPLVEEIYGAGATATAAKTGGRLGGLFAKGFSMSAKAFIKTAGWLGVGISAVEGIISGFKHHSVTAGLQDFAHTLSFGLIKSVKESAAEAGTYLRGKLEDAVKNLKVSVKPGAKQDPTDPFSSTLTDIGAVDQYLINRDRGALPAPTDPLSTARMRTLDSVKQTQIVLTDAQKKLLSQVEAYEKEHGDSIRSFLGGFKSYGEQIKDLVAHKNFLGLNSLQDQLVNFRKSAPDKFKSSVDQMIETAQHASTQIENAFDLKHAGDRLASSFALGLTSGHINKSLDWFLEQLKTLSPEGQKQGVKTALALAQGMKDNKDLPPEEFKKIKEAILNEADDLRKKSAHKSALTAQDLAKAFGALQTVTAAALGSMVDKTSKVLESLGFKAIKTPKNLFQDAGNLTAIVSQLGGLLTGGSAATGASIKARAGGVPILVGEGGYDEVILTTDPKHRDRQMGLLSEYLKRSGMGFQTGGFVNSLNKHIDTSGERAIASALDRMGHALHILFYATSGRRTPAENAAAGGAPQSMHLLGRAMDVGPEIIKTISLATLHRFGLDRPVTYYPGHDERNHIELLGNRTGGGALGGIIKGIGSAIAKHIAAPHVPGSGPMHDIVQGLLDRVAKASNAKIGGAQSSSGGPSFAGISGQGGSAAANMALGKRMAAAYGWTGAQWDALRTLWINESGWSAIADNPSSTAYGIPQGLEGSTHPELNSPGPYADYHTNPRTQIKWGLNYIRGRYTDPASALRYWLSQSPHSYEYGGSVGGRGPVSTTLHGGEHVWTAGEVAKAGGHSVMFALRQLFGGGGQGIGSYQHGGRIGATVGSSVGGYARDLGRAGITQQTARLEQILSDLSPQLSKASEISTKFRKAMRLLIDDNGIFDRLTARAQEIVDLASVKLQSEQFRVGSGGPHRGSLSAVEIARANLGALDTQRTVLDSEGGGLKDARGVARDARREAEKQLGDAKKGTKAYRDAHTALRQANNAIDRINIRITDNNAALAQNAQDQVEALESIQQAQLDAINTKAGNKSANLDRMTRVLAALGRSLSPADIAGRQIDGMKDQLKQLRPLLERAQKSGNKDLAKTIKDQIDELQTQIKEAVAVQFQGAIDAVNATASDSLASIDRDIRMAQLGGTTDYSRIGTDLASKGSIYSKQRFGLSSLLAEASASGNIDQVKNLTEQIAALDVTIAENKDAIRENTKAAVAQQISDVNLQASRASSGFDREDRLSRLGGVTDYGRVGRTLLGRKGAIGAQIEGLQGLLGRANRLGDIDQIIDLTNQIEDLKVSMSENTQAIQDNTDAAFADRVGKVNESFGFTSGVLGAASTFFSTLGQMTGNTNLGVLKGLNQSQGAALDTQRQGLLGALGDLLGYQGSERSGLVGLQGTDLVDTLLTLSQGPVFSGIMNRLDPTQQGAFKDLVNALLGNVNATNDNTNALSALTGTTTQAWSSTSWQWYRNAIFTGSGGLLPRYQIPSMDVGGRVLSDGMIYAHAGEVIPASVSRPYRGGSGDHMEANVYVTEQVQEANPEVISARLLHRWKTRPRS